MSSLFKTEKQSSEKLALLISLQIFLFVLALFIVVDIFVNPLPRFALDKSYFLPTILWLCIGLGVGAIAGGAAKFFFQLYFKNHSIRVVYPFFIANVLLFFSTTGLAFWLSAALPMDWRPVWAVGFLLSPVSTIAGWFISRELSQEALQEELKVYKNLARKRVDSQLQQVKQKFRDTKVEFFPLEKTHAIRLHVFIDHQTLIILVEYTDNYPFEPPIDIDVEAQVSNSQTLPLRYDKSILRNWNEHYTILTIVEECVSLVR